MKKVYSGTLVVLILLLLWYLFFKPYDYIVSFRSNTFPGAINQTIKTWHKKIGSNMPIVQKDLLSVSQHLKFGDSTLIYDWKIVPLTDSTSKVKVRIKDLDNSLMNKIKIPFTETVLEKRSKTNLLGFVEILNNHIKNFKVKIIGEDELQSKYCACLSIEGEQQKKAMGMMINYPYLTGFIIDNEIKENGIPFVEITNWNRDNDSIIYNFCYPIIYHDSLPRHKEIKYKEFKRQKAIKAIYNGNYITSDRAWYKLLDYAERKNINVIHEPIEFFYNNPNQGGDELNWKAEIYLPIKSDNK